MSGGVDSSVAAGILAREGYDVVGVTLQLYDHGEAVHRKGACCAGQDIQDARRVAEDLGIPHYVLNYEERFRKAVIDPFARAYVDGETPIPCVLCNQTVKFADLLETARELDANTLATGHYVRSHIVDPATGRRGLFRPTDNRRDQSYFLFATTQQQVDFLRFPLGHLPKAKTREIARELGLSVAEKNDSQDICFVPHGRYSDIVAKMHPSAATTGDIVHMDGRVLGRHDGIIHFTIGQRRGVGVAAGEPVYVVHLDPISGRVIVGPREALTTHRLRLRQFNWLGDMALDQVDADGLSVFAKVRSTRPPVAARLLVNGDDLQVLLEDGESGVAPGQACVLYHDQTPDSRLLGGGWIAAATRHAEAERAITAILADDRTQAARAS